MACLKGDDCSIITFLTYGADIGATDYSGVNCGPLLAVLWDLNRRNALYYLFKIRKHVDEAAV
ncbi:hypothetical protein LLEC1_07142 [Akanthomyces lecanii]|uniref:Uncharacterized protein n=1 Tax=Cordyceps confragosa TaxID=2714763 RepID=A0A179ILN1_CORDF|nr:hypothetical protein LLEC1_07142 [Akanthomyces lecanii]